MTIMIIARSKRNKQKWKDEQQQKGNKGTSSCIVMMQQSFKCFFLSCRDCYRNVLFIFNFRFGTICRFSTLNANDIELKKGRQRCCCLWCRLHYRSKAYSFFLSCYSSLQKKQFQWKSWWFKWYSFIILVP